MSTLSASKVTRRESLNIGTVSLEKFGEQEWRKESQDIPHVFLTQPNLTKMCSLVVLLTNKQAIYCTIKCFILTLYSFLALWLLQVYPLKATQTINQNSTPFHSVWIYSPAGEHTAFIDADGGDIHLCRGEETTLYVWIYVFRQVAVCRQETPINTFYCSCLERDSVLHIYRRTVTFSKENTEANPWQNYNPQFITLQWGIYPYICI